MLSGATGPQSCPTKPTSPCRQVATGDYSSAFTGQLSQLLNGLGPTDRDVLRHPHPEVLEIIDPRPLLDPAAAIAARYGTAGLLVAETLAAGLARGKALYFGTERNVGRRLAEIAAELGVVIRVL